MASPGQTLSLVPVVTPTCLRWILMGVIAAFASLGAEIAVAQDEQPAPAEEKPADDPEALKARIAELEAEVARLNRQIQVMELEQLGALVRIEESEGKPTETTVSLLKTWTGSAAELEALKGFPNLSAVYVDNETFDDAAAAKLAELPGITSLTLMSPQVTGKALESLKGLGQLEMLFLTGSGVGDEGLAALSELKELQVLALSRTKITDAALDTLKGLTGLKALYLIGTDLSEEAIAQLEEALPETAVYH